MRMLTLKKKKIFHALRIIYHSVAIKIQYLNTGVVFKNVYLVGHPSSKILREIMGSKINLDLARLFFKK